MTNISSDYIKVFPSVKRNIAKDSTARFTTEYNLVNLINRLTNKRSFVIDITDGQNGAPAFLSFNIDGYYFELNSNGCQSLTDSALAAYKNDIYAQIVYATNNSGSINQIAGDNSSSGAFEGVKFVNEEPTSGASYLHILTKVNNKWMLPDDGKINRIFSIDDGDLDSN